MENLDAKLAVSTNTPYAILGYLGEHEVNGLYFLDVNLNSSIDGIALAEKIRKYDPRGFIVFVTMYGEALHITFKYKVEALDFITKDDTSLEARICECIRNAYNKYTATSATPSLSQDRFVFKRSNDSLISLCTSKILYFESSPTKSHRTTVYSEDSVYDFYSSLNDIEKSIDETFFRCHKSVIVNLKKITEVDGSGRIAHLSDGSTCPISSRKMARLKELLRKAL